MPLIDASEEIAALELIQELLPDEKDKQSVRYALELLRNAAPVDAVPVVRCKACVNALPAYVGSSWYTCAKRCYSSIVHADEYCSKGENKEVQP